MNFQLWLPPSEGKTAPEKGAPLDLSNLVFGSELRPARQQILDELTRVSSGAEAAKILKLGAKADQMLASNRDLLNSPTAPAYRVYTGVLWEAARIEDFPKWHDNVLVFSGLFGILRAGDFIPDHRLSMGIKLPEAGGLASFWKRQIPPGQVPVVDLRSGTYASALAAPAESLAVNVKTADGKVVSHWAKHWRGLLAYELMRQDIEDIADVPRCAKTMEGVSEVEVDSRKGILTLHLS